MAESYYDKIKSDPTLAPETAEELQAKFDAATRAKYAAQAETLKDTENQFYNKMYDTQLTTMDTIRKQNAEAVASGANRGVQAANELSAILGLQSEAATGATDIANQATTMAKEETASMLENVLNAETQSAQQSQAFAEILNQGAQLDVNAEQNRIAWQQLIEQIRQTNPALANNLQTELNNTGTISSETAGSITPEQQAAQDAIDTGTDTGVANYQTDINNVIKNAIFDDTWKAFGADDDSTDKLNTYNAIKRVFDKYSIDSSDLQDAVDKAYEYVDAGWFKGGDANKARDYLNAYIAGKSIKPIKTSASTLKTDMTNLKNLIEKEKGFYGMGNFMYTNLMNKLTTAQEKNDEKAYQEVLEAYNQYMARKK